MSRYSHPRLLVIGYGVVGKATASALVIPDHVDLGDDAVLSEYDYFILCLPTPTKKGRQDLSAIDEWIERINLENRDATIIIRSTVLPGTTRKYLHKYKTKIVHVPEFLTASSVDEDSLKPELLVIGTNKADLRKKVAELFLKRITPKKIIYCSPETAECIKYSMNSFFALKVVFANQLYDVCGEVGADFNLIKRAFELHKWGSRNGWDVLHGGYRGYKGKCLPKDVKAFINRFDVPLLAEMYRINKKLIK